MATTIENYMTNGAYDDVETSYDPEKEARKQRTEIRKKFKAIGYKVSFKTISFEDLARGSKVSATVKTTEGQNITQRVIGHPDYIQEFFKEHEKAYQAIEEIDKLKTGIIFN